MTDILFVRGLRVEAVIGVFDWEREVLQELLFDVDLHIDMSAACASDQVEDALSYVDVAAEITAITRARKAKLVEFLAEEIATALLGKWPVRQIRLARDQTNCGSGGRRRRRRNCAHVLIHRWAVLFTADSPLSHR